VTPDAERWNHNIHYHGLVLGALPRGCRRVLDVGCGEGMLTRRLHGRAEQVTGIDVDEPSIGLARRQASARSGIEYVVGDVLAHPFEPASYDAVVSVAALHHMDARSALECMGQLLRPGGILAVIGLARSRSLADVPYDLAGVLANRAARAGRAWFEPASPVVWPPPETHRAMRRIAEEVLPGARWRRRLYFRYSLVWTRPA
jgi:2-polyprenyl-3-methyl-5-hydroxy-6-metoxy-1,4-benzoquinol methylase